MAAAIAAASLGVCFAGPPATPIEHVIVVVGENQTFDSVFATYVPSRGESVRNLLSEGIVRADGTPGPNYAVARQDRASGEARYSLDPSRAGPYEHLPRPTLIGVLNGHFRAVGNGPDPRFPAELAPGPFQITRHMKWPNIATPGFRQSVENLTAATGDPVHRFFQMWQQTGGDNSRLDLYTWVAVTTGMGGDTIGVTRAYPGQGGEVMGFVNIGQGDAPVFMDLARRYAMSDNYHQPIMGGTGANFFALATGDVAFYNTNGSPSVPPANQIENPNPVPGTENFYARDGYQGGSYVSCADQSQPGVASILKLLERHQVPSRCAPGHFYLINNYAPGYDLDGHRQPIGPNNYNYPPQTVRTIAEALSEQGVSWGWYTGGRDPADLTEEVRDGHVNLATARRVQYNFLGDPLVASTAVMTNPQLRSHLKGLASFSADLEAGKLPAVAFVVPKVLESGHPGQSVLVSFEDFLRHLVTQVQAQRKTWAHTAILATMDEGGGHFDSGYIQSLDFFGDGTRIPLLVVSPYVRTRHIDHQYNDHVSILKFIERNWAIRPITPRSRDNLPDPVSMPSDPYRPSNGPAIGDLMTLFDFSLRTASPRPKASSTTGERRTPESVRDDLGRPKSTVRLSPVARVGKSLFFDKTLSSSGRLACASCHDPANAYGPPPGSGPVMRGGQRMDRPGSRAVPSLRYLQDVPRFTDHLYVARSDDAEDVGPGGGLAWGGRADDLAQQALIPLLDGHEMANSDVRELAARLRASAEAARLRALATPVTWANDDRVAHLAAESIARFETEDPSFHPYDSRYDAYLRGEGALSPQELHGLQLFNSADKGNCAECHPSATGPGGRPPEFTDFRFAAIGVPRNPAIAANENPGFYDLGLCGPSRTDLERARPEDCGLFETPSLRNVARRQYFFHNARFRTLGQALHFYVDRDLDPARWYPRRDGHLVLYDDLPPAYRGNVDHSDPPFDRNAGEPPALNDAEIADVIAFLRTLDDRS